VAHDLIVLASRTPCVDREEMRIAWVLVVAACGGGKGGLSVQGTFDRTVDVLCGRAHECRAQFPTDQGFMFEDLFQDTEPACIAGFEENSQVAEIQASVDAGRIIFRPGDAEDCSSFLEDLPCTELWGSFFDGNPPQPSTCDSSFEGTVATGGTCTIDLDCIEETGCDPSSMTCGG
jgi:hypothetical protein